MTFRAARLVKSYEMTVPASREDVFPLLCPMREYQWIPYWACEMLHSASGYAEDGCVFRTNFPQRGEMAWVVTRHDPPERIDFAIFKAHSHVYTLRVALEALEEAGSRLRWEHAFTALSEEGNMVLCAYTDDEHRAHMQRIERCLVHFLRTGEMIDDPYRTDESTR
jgi:hypothetical protein